MGKSNRNIVLWTIGVVSVVNLILGWWAPNAWLVFGGGIALAYVLLRWTRLRRTASNGAKEDAEALDDPDLSPLPSRIRHEPVAPDDTDGLVEQMLEQERFALLLRPQLAKNLAKPQLQRAMSMLEEKMALVPSGSVTLYRTDENLESDLEEEDWEGERPERLVNVDHFFLDRYPVTNRQYYEFVSAGGYEQMTFWDQTILPAVLDFVDRTGMPGPRYWREGCCLRGREDHPVVGICWYEAAAYARWVGKRLPTDAEWVKAGSWPVPVAGEAHVQRRYPWGDHMDRRRANLWGSGPGHLVPVDQYADGVSVGGVYQLIGNVWEWTSGNYLGGPFPPGELVLESPMKSIRGGAFDTYFDNQASCQFQSGEKLLARKHNIGMRLAVGVCDLVFGQAADAQPKTASESVPESVPETEIAAQEVLT